MRVAPGEKAQLRAIAAPPGSSSPSWCACARSVGPSCRRTDATTIRELRRLGGLLKMVHVDSGGAYSRETAAALDALHAAIRGSPAS